MSLRPAHPVKHRRDRKQLTALVGVLRRPRKTTKLFGRVARRDRNDLRHGGILPATLNYDAMRLGIPIESKSMAVGIRHVGEFGGRFT